MKKRNAAALAGICAVCAIGGTLAYFNQTMEVENNFDTAKYGSTVIEEFKPSDGTNWEPGAEVGKVVTVKNTGDRPLIVRVKMDEKWTRTVDGTVKTISEISGADKDIKNEVVGDKIVTVYQNDSKDGVANKNVDDTVVHKNLSDSKNWIDGGDGWYYYAAPLAAAGTTENFLESVKLDAQADMGAYDKTKYYSTDNGENWTEFRKADDVEYTEAEMEAYLAALEPAQHITNIRQDVTLNEEKSGYADADYVLTITAQTVQADADAVKEVFGIDFTAIPDGCDWGFDLTAETN